MGSKTLTEGTPWKGILSFMFPIFMGLLLQQLYNTVDTLVVGNFAGEGPLAAVGACGVLTMAFLALANGFSAGASVLIAQLFGGGAEKEMRRQASSALLLLLGMGVVASVAGIFISRFALRYILATPESLIPMADTYFKIYAAGLVFQFGYKCRQCSAGYCICLQFGNGCCRSCHCHEYRAGGFMCSGIYLHDEKIPLIPLETAGIYF